MKQLITKWSVEDGSLEYFLNKKIDRGEIIVTVIPTQYYNDKILSATIVYTESDHGKC